MKGSTHEKNSTINKSQPYKTNRKIINNKAKIPTNSELKTNGIKSKRPVTSKAKNTKVQATVISTIKTVNTSDKKDLSKKKVQKPKIIITKTKRKGPAKKGWWSKDE